MNGRFPDNRILSHDLLEGCYARSGLLSDVELFEDYPATYAADTARRHRWIRGDWQIASWLLPRVPGAGGAAVPQPAVGPVAVEDRRQPAAQPGADRAAAAAAGGLDRAAVRAGVDPRGGHWHRPGAAAARLAAAVVPQAAGRGGAPAPDCGRAIGRDAMRAGRPRARVPAVRSLRQRRRGAAHHLAHAGLAPAAARMEPVRRARGQRGARVAGVPSVDVDGAGGRARDRRVPGRWRGRRCWVSRRRSCCCGWSRPASPGG